MARSIQFVDCPHQCEGEEIRVGQLRCRNGFWIYWDSNGNASRRQRHPRIGFTGTIHFRDHTGLAGHTMPDKNSEMVHEFRPMQRVGVAWESNGWYLVVIDNDIVCWLPIAHVVLMDYRVQHRRK